MIASGLPCNRGMQLAIDVTARSVLTRDGLSRPRAHWQDGVCAAAARGDKERTYPEFALSGRCKLVALAIELGGRFSQETAEFLRELASAKAEASPDYLRKSVARAFERRWSKMLSIAVARACARSIMWSKAELSCSPAEAGGEPWLQDVLTAGRFD